jgi:inositol-1,3,4-trisphosphate 5/6-kinase/inositol-tetrakisphosphate 1-kinase
MLDPLRQVRPGSEGLGAGLLLSPQGRPGSSSSLFDDDGDGRDAAGGGSPPEAPPPPTARVLVGAPTQVVVLAPPAGGGDGGAPARAAGAALASVSAAGLAPPLLAKPLHAGGQPGAHALALLTDRDAIAALARSCEDDPLLPGLAPPVILQPYVPHRPPLFKVFVIGPYVALARRPSLTVPPPPEDVCAAVGGALSLARVSAYISPAEAAAAAAAEAEKGGGGEQPAQPEPALAPDPPRWVLEALAAEMRAALGLQVFNFDLIRVARDLMDGGGGEGGGGGANGATSNGAGAPAPAAATAGPCPPGADFLVIDINYFPGIEKLPGYEGLMVGFLQWATGPEGTAATTGWEAEVTASCAAHQAAVSAAAAAVMAAAAPPGDQAGEAAAPRPFPARPPSGLQRLSMSLSQVPSRRVTGPE